MNEESIMYQSIKNGMLAKRGPDYDYVKDIEIIRTNYKAKIDSMKAKNEEIQKILDQNENYQKYMRVKTVMTPFFEMWRAADRKIGQLGVEKGDLFEKTVKNNLMPLILKRAAISSDQKYRI